MRPGRARTPSSARCKARSRWSLSSLYPQHAAILLSSVRILGRPMPCVLWLSVQVKVGRRTRRRTRGPSA
jgi:hypothetical protein